MKKIALTLAAFAALAACGGNDDMGTQPMATQPAMVMSEPTMNKL